MLEHDWEYLKLDLFVEKFNHHSAMADYRSLIRHPKIEIRRLEDDYCEFLLKETDVSVANAIRRVILADVSE